MYGVYADFFQTAVADYQSEFEQMSKLGKSLAEETANALQTRCEETARGHARTTDNATAAAHRRPQRPA